MERHAKLPLQVVNDTLSYLVEKPYKEVAGLIQTINQNFTVIVDPGKDTDKVDNSKAAKKKGTK